MRNIIKCLSIIGILIISQDLSSQRSVARQWNEILLEAIRDDFARPTIHARNLYHTSIAMYDLWAVYDDQAETYVLGKTIGDFTSSLEAFPQPTNVDSARGVAISYAQYRILRHRFRNSPGRNVTYAIMDILFDLLQLDSNDVSTDYQSGSPSALGNYMAQTIIEFGLQDGSNEINDYVNQFYEPGNPSSNPNFVGVRPLADPNRWQPLAFDLFVDQSGHSMPGVTPEFISPEWGQVQPFALTNSELSVRNRDGNPFWIYHDPGAPPYIDVDGGLQTDNYAWNFALVSLWGSHHDPSDGVLMDISPASIGNLTSFPAIDSLPSFYSQEGGDPSLGHSVNPVTGLPYQPQIVPRGDYGRVLAEFWADGPDSETPPGHWFTILNYVNDHPELTKKFKGEGAVLDDLEWDVKSYFALGGALHDAAVAAWGIKGWYDYIRPITAIRSMAARGQSTDTSLSNYHPAGIPLIDGYIEVIDADDSLSAGGTQHVGKIKLYTWKGPKFIEDPEKDEAGVGWILAENWWPYQRPTFVTPPFAGYVSGHSTFSRAAAEVLTRFTGDPFFPGGIGEFVCKANEFLVFEEGPSQDIILQWATYRDASDQTSLSRIWGGIHPPIDDIPGRVIGEKVGNAAFELAEQYFTSTITSSTSQTVDIEIDLYPNPLRAGSTLQLRLDRSSPPILSTAFTDIQGRKIPIVIQQTNGHTYEVKLPSGMKAGLYVFVVSNKYGSARRKIILH